MANSINTIHVDKQNDRIIQIVVPVFTIGRGKKQHHKHCGMVLAAESNGLKVKEVEYNHNLPMCSQCYKRIQKDIDLEICGMIDEKPTFRVAIIAPYQLEDLNIERMDKLFSLKKDTHHIRIGVPRSGKDKPFHIAIDSYAHDNGFVLVCRDAYKGQYPTELNEWLISKSDAVIIYNDGDWFFKRAIRYCEDNHIRFAVIEV